LECRTCIRNVWDEPLGQMSSAPFARIVEGLKTFSPVPTAFFGGFGEPLAHPDIVDMVAHAKAAGAPVELITNGTLLTQDMSRSLIEAGLDMLWVSLDGATPESYTDVRLGAALPEVLANLRGFRDARRASHPPRPQMGIVFVAMRRNIADLPEVIRLGDQSGAKRFLVTNVLPYSAEMLNEVLYSRALTDIVYIPSMFRLELPKIDVNETTRQALYYIMRGGYSVSFAGGNLGEIHDRCLFIESGVTTISWE
ncbi:MAG: radical SAM protein, partial [Deltaproteobacteria bacterium]|nr:radical SAM protein [Deltaproteobacteria bacterium]